MQPFPGPPLIPPFAEHNQPRTWSYLLKTISSSPRPNCSLDYALENYYEDVGQWLKSEVLHGVMCTLLYLKLHPDLILDLPGFTGVSSSSSSSSSASRTPCNIGGIHAFISCSPQLQLLVRCIVCYYRDLHVRYLEKIAYRPHGWDPKATLAWYFTFRRVYRRDLALPYRCDMGDGIFYICMFLI